MSADGERRRLLGGSLALAFASLAFLIGGCAAPSKPASQSGKSTGTTARSGAGAAGAGAASRSAPAARSSSTTRSAQARKPQAVAKAAPRKGATPQRAAPKSAAPPAQAVAQADRVFLRPVRGAVIKRFDGRGNKGLDFAGSLGEPVLAAREGKVVYAGSGLRGYGNLVMIQHDKRFVSAYAHNSALLVKEGQGVKKGQAIARMGSSDTDRVKLHFELRRNGTAVDPTPYFMAGAAAAAPAPDTDPS